MCGERVHNRFFMKYMHAIGQHERLSLANGLLQMFSQADKLRNVSLGMPGVRKKKRKGYLNLKIENRMPTHRTNIRIIEYSGPVLVIICSFFTSRWIFFFNLHYCLFKINEKKPSIVDFFFFPCCTEIVSNHDPRTEVRTEP